jgi:hypothetical protein
VRHGQGDRPPTKGAEDREQIKTEEPKVNPQEIELVKYIAEGLFVCFGAWLLLR